MASKKYNSLKQKFLAEMDFVSGIGVHVFAYPFIGRSRASILFYNITYSLVLCTSVQLVITLFLVGLSDWFEIINIAPNLGVCLMILIKYGKINKNRNVYQGIFNHYRNNLWDIVSNTAEHLKILEQSVKTTKLITRFEYYYTIILIVVVNLFPRIIMVYENDIVGNDIQYLYPFEGWYPFDKIKWYYAAYAWEGLMTTVVIYIYAFCNILHVSFTRYICMELKILGNSMEGLVCFEDFENINTLLNIEEIHKSIKIKFKVIIKRHQVLAKITSDLDEVLGDGMLLTYIFGSVFICLTIFTATVVSNLYKSLRYFSFFLSLLIDVFFQCIIGQLLINHSEKFERAIYFTDWSIADLKTQKMLVILLMRAEKPFSYSAKGYLTMNLDTFSGICSLSYQLFNLLRTAYS